jgi:hypothetical protein
MGITDQVFQSFGSSDGTGAFVMTACGVETGGLMFGVAVGIGEFVMDGFILGVTDTVATGAGDA